LLVVTAYILIQTEVGKAAQVAKDIVDITGVQQAQAVTGPYDVIVRAEARNIDELGKLVSYACRQWTASPGPSPVRSCTCRRGVGHIGGTHRRHPRVNSGQFRQAENQLDDAFDAALQVLNPPVWQS
jgi:DNA-binding Lrp family transcriptional regulator